MTAFAVVLCKEHGRQELDGPEYDRQMEKPDDLWVCPVCHELARFDDVESEKTEGYLGSVPDGEANEPK